MSQQNQGFIKILIVVNEVASILKFIPILRHRGYQIEVTLSAEKAIENIGTICPHIVLLSWDLKSPSIAKTHAIFRDELKIPCLVFSENQTKRSIALLMRSRIPHTLYHPLSGEGIDRQIQLVLREKNQTKSVGKKTEEPGVDDSKNEPTKSFLGNDSNKNEDNEEENIILKQEDVPEFRSLLARCVKDVIRGNLSLSNKAEQKIDIVSSLYAMTIPSKHFRGYLLATQADNNMNPNFISQFYYKLQRRMKRLGDPLHEVENAIPIQVEPINFSSCVKNFSDFVIADSYNGQEVMFAYMPLSSLPEVDWLEKDGFLAVHFKDWLLADSKLLFDLFIHMPVNKKYILYLKKDTYISKSILDKFLKMSVNKIYIKSSEKNHFLSYCIQIKINESLSKAQKIA